MINNVLLTGYTAFLTDAFVAAAFPNSRILIAGETQMQSSFSRKISVYTGALTREICQKFSQTYEFNQVVFFSHSIAPFRDIDGAEHFRWCWTSALWTPRCSILQAPGIRPEQPAPCWRMPHKRFAAVLPTEPVG